VGDTEKAADTGGKISGLLATVTDVVFQKSLDRVFTGFGLVLVILATIGGIPKYLPLDTVSRGLCGGVGAALMLVGLVINWAPRSPGTRAVIKRRMGVVIFSISVLWALLVIAAFFDLIPLPHTDRFHGIEDMVIIGLAVASWFGFIPAYMTASSLANLPEKIDGHIAGINKMETELASHVKDAARATFDSFAVTASSLASLPVQIEKHLAEINKMETRLVGHVEDATRATLNSFAKIFEKAVHLVAHAERELIFVNFAMNFGHPHLLNANIASDYESLTGRNFETDVSFFATRLKGKTSELPYVQILTVSDKAAEENFLTLLKKQAGYAELDIYAESQQMHKAKQDVIARVDFDMKDIPRPHPKRLRVTDSIPIQVLIAGLPPRDGGSGLRTGCLVLMVGTEILNEGRPGGGFYTELESMVGMFRDLAVALIEDAERRQSK
jgi:hypothetical protein